MPNTVSYSVEESVAHGARLAGPSSRSVSALLAVLRAYKLIVSPWFAGCCRFEPSCSDFMREAVARHGVIKGVRLGLGRLGRCHPLGGHGFDPVPDRR